MGRRNDTSVVGASAEAEAKRLLEERGYTVVDLNLRQTNHPTYDLEASSNGRKLKISVKCARAKRDLSLGPASSVRRLEPETFVFAFLPRSKGEEIDIAAKAYEFWIVPSAAVLRDALSAHEHYWTGDPEQLERNTVRIKDKKDTPGGRSRSGAIFSDWSRRYRDAWHLLAA